MAIEPKTPRKRAIKKSTMSKRKGSNAEAGVPDKDANTDVAVVTEAGFTEPAEPAAPKTRKKAAVPVPLFQAPTPEKAPAKARKATAKPAKEDTEKEAPVSEKSDSDSDSSDSPSSDSESRSSRNRRRRRGGRGRRKPNGAEGSDE